MPKRIFPWDPGALFAPAALFEERTPLTGGHQLNSATVNHTSLIHFLCYVLDLLHRLYSRAKSENRGRRKVEWVEFQGHIPKVTATIS